jgi:hypothetical protein
VENLVHHSLEHERYFSPYLKFMYALNAPESKRQYPRRLQVFLDFLRIDCLTVEEKSNKYKMDLVTNGVVITDAIKFVQQKKEELNQINTNKDISGEEAKEGAKEKEKEKEKEGILSSDNAALNNTKNKIF